MQAARASVENLGKSRISGKLNLCSADGSPSCSKLEHPHKHLKHIAVEYYEGFMKGIHAFR
jgi:hypothetical protein